MSDSCGYRIRMTGLDCLYLEHFSFKVGSLQKLAVGIVMLIFSVSWDGTEGRARPIYKLIKLLLCKDLGGSQA